MNKKNTLGGDAVKLTASKIITLCITLATTMLLARFRTIEEYGTYSQLLLVTNLITTFFILGLPNSINYFLARAETLEEKQKFLNLYYTLSTIISIIIGLVLVLSIPMFENYFHNPTLNRFYYFFALYPWASIVLSSLENVLVVYHKTDLLMGFRILLSMALLGIVLVLQWFSLGFTEYIIGFVIINTVFGASTYIIVSRISGGIHFHIDLSIVRSIFVFSIPLGLATMVGTLNTDIDKLLVGYLLNTEQLAIYTNAARELPLTIVASSVTAVLLPHLTLMIKHNRDKEAIQLWGYATEFSFIIIALIVSGVFVFAEDALAFLYSAKYLPGVSVFRIYTLNLLLRCTYFGIILNAHGKTKRILYCSILSLLINISLNPILYFAIGIIGPAIATFIAILCILLLQLKMTAKLSRVKMVNVFPWKRILINICINTFFGICFFLIKRILPVDTWIGSFGESLLLGIFWAMIYLLFVKKRLFLLWKLINMEEVPSQ